MKVILLTQTSLTNKVKLGFAVIVKPFSMVANERNAICTMSLAMPTMPNFKVNK